MGIAPVITDGDLVLGESGAICDYICGRYGGGRLRPGPDDADFADHLFWFHWSNGTFMTTLMMQLVLAAGGADGIRPRRSSATAAGAAGRWSRPGLARRRSSAGRTSPRRTS